MRLRSFLGSFALLTTLASGAALLAAPPVTPDPPQVRRVARALSATLESLDFYGSQEAIQVRFTLTNHTDHTVWVLRWQLPSEDMDAPLFAVTRDGEQVAYEGPLVKRATPESEDYVAIPTGGSYSAVFDPSAHYDMALQGQYVLQLRTAAYNVRHTAPEARNQGLEASLLVRPNQPGARLDTAPQDRLVSENRPSTTFAFQGIPGGRRNATVESVIGGYNKCTTAQQSTLQTAHANAITLTGKSMNTLETSPGGTLETTWFGAYTTTRHTLLKDHFTKANAAFTNQSVIYDCSCKKSYYAYVYPTQPYKIYLCRAFWSAPALGTDSKAGTLIHEMMHFNVVASTNDYVYGTTGALNLAKTNPDQAVMNSDNHEYFAENQK